jgi:hypothetical protein
MSMETLWNMQWLRNIRKRYSVTKPLNGWHQPNKPRCSDKNKLPGICGHLHKSVAFFFANSIYNKHLIGVKNVMSACVLLHYTNLLRTVPWHGKTIGVSWQPCEWNRHNLFWFHCKTASYWSLLHMTNCRYFCNAMVDVLFVIRYFIFHTFVVNSFREMYTFKKGDTALFKCCYLIWATSSYHKDSKQIR